MGESDQHESVALRGKCEEYAKAAVASDPTLRLVRGWYIDPTWGRQEHWWTERPDGTIYDPTSAQFPMGGVADWYEEYRGTFSCEGCGVEVSEDDHYLGCCSGQCYGRMVGVAVSGGRDAARPPAGDTPGAP